MSNIWMAAVIIAFGIMAAWGVARLFRWLGNKADITESEFDDILVDTVRSTFPEYEQARFIAHYRGLLNHWVEAEAR